MEYNAAMFLMPKIKFGKWALYSLILMIALFVVANLFVDAPGDETSGINWPVIPGFVAGIIASGLAIYAIAKEKERSAIAFLIPIILLLLLFLGSRQT